ncbi:MAG TPA: hypothetical protein VNO21_11330, partial [Polyangiaceae bacterium]|nr:hypothetical protein [Polyangiaceae bacterium]
LSRLARARLIVPVRHGQFWVGGDLDPLQLPEYLTAPFPSYLSMQSALFFHGMIEQIPVVMYVASLARTQRIRTKVGTFSVHHLMPELFGGFDTRDGIKVASPEKALFDVAYLSATRTRLFSALPEVELPKGFRKKRLEYWMTRIPSARGRTIVRNKIDQFLSLAQ